MDIESRPVYWTDVPEEQRVALGRDARPRGCLGATRVINDLKSRPMRYTPCLAPLNPTKPYEDLCPAHYRLRDRLVAQAQQQQ